MFKSVHTEVICIYDVYWLCLWQYLHWWKTRPAEMINEQHGRSEGNSDSCPTENGWPPDATAPRRRDTFYLRGQKTPQQRATTASRFSFTSMIGLPSKVEMKWASFSATLVERTVKKLRSFSFSWKACDICDSLAGINYKEFFLKLKLRTLGQKLGFLFDSFWFSFSCLWLCALTPNG